MGNIKVVETVYKAPCETHRCNNKQNYAIYGGEMPHTALRVCRTCLKEIILESPISVIAEALADKPEVFEAIVAMLEPEEAEVENDHLGEIKSEVLEGAVDVPVDDIEEIVSSVGETEFIPEERFLAMPESLVPKYEEILKEQESKIKEKEKEDDIIIEKVEEPKKEQPRSGGRFAKKG